MGPEFGTFLSVTLVVLMVAPMAGVSAGVPQMSVQDPGSIASSILEPVKKAVSPVIDVFNRVKNTVTSIPSKVRSTVSTVQARVVNAVKTVSKDIDVMLKRFAQRKGIINNSTGSMPGNGNIAG